MGLALLLGGGTVAQAEWEAVVLPGGLPGATNLRDDERVQDLLRHQNDAGRAVGAICAGPIALANAGVLEGRQATCYPGFEDQLTGSSPCSDPVVVDGNVFTSRGVGTALPFALALVSRLRDEPTAATLRDRMLVST